MEGEKLFILLVQLVLTCFVGGLFLLYPLIVRRGLLFGVYVGERVFEGEESRRITRSWYAGMICAIAASLVVGTAAVLAFRHPLAALAPPAIQVLAFVVFYLRAHFRARAIAPAGPPPAAAAPLLPVPARSAASPLAAIIIGGALGLLAVCYGWVHYPDLPSAVPTHFGPSGRPDAWKPKSFFTVMLLPLMTLFMGIGLGCVAWLTSRAKRAIRLFDHGASLEAQLRFRTAVTRFLSGVAVLTTIMLAGMSVMSIQVGMGQRAGLHPIIMGMSVLLPAYALAGTLYIAIRYGQGGARLERTGAGTPLTDGLADNRNWVLGVFYINRDDPSIFVERRFGFGYTLNLGNWKAVLFFAFFLAVLFGIIVTAALTG